MSYHEGSNWQAKKQDEGKPLYEKEHFEKEVNRRLSPDGDRQKKWLRYRFFTKSTDDYRPLIFNPKFPWWCSGESMNGDTATIIAYLPVNEDLKKYWDDAFDIEFTEHDKIEFSSRFPKPEYFKES